jgi:hypothetical protein
VGWRRIGQRYCAKGGFMMFYAITTKILFMLVFVAGVEAQSFSTVLSDSDSQKKFGRQVFEHLSTPAIAEPEGYTAACFATNTDAVNRIVVAEIFDWRGDNVTETSSCGVPQGPGITCQSTARYRDSALRCVVSTSGRATNLRGSLSTSVSPYPFTSPANSTIAAQ